MKTLDELIKSYECIGCEGCAYLDDCFDHHTCECPDRDNDALQYLKNYREMIDSLAKAIIEAYEKIKPLIEDENETD